VRLTGLVRLRLVDDLGDQKLAVLGKSEAPVLAAGMVAEQGR